MSHKIGEVGTLDKIFTRKKIKDGIDLYIHSTQKFKTTTFCLFLHQNLERATATKTALLPFVLKRGTMEFPTSRSLSLYLEELYGASMGGDVLKRGETQIIQFFLETVNPKYLNGENVLDKGLKAFRELVMNPLIEGDGFKKDYVAQEKEVLKRNIESLYSDKFNYSIERCFQEMCKDEAYSIYRYGDVSDLDKFDNVDLYNYYKECLKRCPIDIFVLGDIDEEKVSSKIEELFTFQREENLRVETDFTKKYIREIRFVEEKQDINQGKLSMGFRTNTHYGDEDYYALMVYSGILGGGAHSKLFQNVREKASLAYYAFSRLEKTKGLMMISSGIEFSNYDKAVDIINKQLEDIRRGIISDYEFDSTVKSITNSLKEAADNPSMIISLYLDGIINGVEESAKDIIEKINRVTKEDVQKVAQKIILDTVFFLNQK